jgi:hypothetical protein
VDAALPLAQQIRLDLDALCSDVCAGRAPGTPGAEVARALLRDALRDVGLTVQEQALPECGGVNLLVHVPGGRDRWVLVAAHYDHLGARGTQVYRGADDNAAGVSQLLALARSLATRPPEGRGVVLAWFDCEEPPSFLGGSPAYVDHPSVALAQIDLTICMDLVGHPLGPVGAPADVGESLFVLGAEHGQGLAALVDSVVEPGVQVRRANADIIPPLSDYGPFWQRAVPFLFLTCGRSRHYHTPEDKPERLDEAVLGSRARWLEQLTRAACALPLERISFLPEGRDDAATLRSLLAIASALNGAEAKRMRALLEGLLAQCDDEGRGPPSHRAALQAMVSKLEQTLA